MEEKPEISPLSKVDVILSFSVEGTATLALTTSSQSLTSSACSIFGPLLVDTNSGGLGGTRSEDAAG